MNNGKGTVLWLDDDGPDRFTFEKESIEDAGYHVAWALDVAEAVDKLATIPMRAVLLDQMLPFTEAIQPPGGWHILEWSGCILLHWLRGAALPGAAPEEARRRFSELCGGRKPLDANAQLPVQIISAYYSDDLMIALRALSSGMGRDASVIMAKPVDTHEFEDFLRYLDESDG